MSSLRQNILFIIHFFREVHHADLCEFSEFYP